MKKCHVLRRVKRKKNDKNEKKQANRNSSDIELRSSELRILFSPEIARPLSWQASLSAMADGFLNWTFEKVTCWFVFACVRLLMNQTTNQISYNAG